MLTISESKKSVFHILISSPRQRQDEDEFLKFLDHIITQDSFGLILEVHGEKSFSPKAKKDLGIWFKSNKQRLSRKCTGFARISSSATKMDTFKSRAMRLAMPCPYIVLSELDKALKWFK